VALDGQDQPRAGTGSPSGGFAVYFRDPDGITLELLQPPMSAVRAMRRTSGFTANVVCDVWLRVHDPSARVVTSVGAPGAFLPGLQLSAPCHAEAVEPIMRTEFSNLAYVDVSIAPHTPPPTSASA